jgi:crotonobetainyl-CoA:carnitine CoA-transferase CaiB-like acyl-CoA transferase
VTALTQVLTDLAWSAAGSEDPAAPGEVIFTGSGSLRSVFPVSDLASAAVATAALSIGELIYAATGRTPPITVDRHLSSMWFDLSIRPIGWTLPPLWDPIAGAYRARDGWIRLHTNAPHHRAAAERVLGPQADKESTARAVAAWAKTDLENAIVEAGGCAAEMRSTAEWERHPQGQAVTCEPLAQVVTTDDGSIPKWSLPAERPLEGLRVLDLTRVLAGPVATRFLAGYGADVLRLDPPHWNEPGAAPGMTLGKRCARIDLREKGDRAVFEELLSRADLFIHGYRPDALARLGFDASARRKLSPGLIDVCLCAYGWSGPWAGRRGFDSLVQMSTGIAEYGMQRLGADKPSPLPVQAIDHATGYLMAAAAIRAITRRFHGRSTEARLSLARTAKFLIDHLNKGTDEPLAPETEADWSPTIEATSWGPAQRLVPPVQIEGVPMRWDRPARDLGSDAPRW